MRFWPILCAAGLLTASLLLAAAPLWAAAPADVLEFFGTAAGALSDNDPYAFIDHFDKTLPNYAAFKERIETLLAANEVTSVVEVLNDDEATPTRTIDLDWVLTATEKGPANGASTTRREVVKCKIERRGKGWKIVALEPMDFFKF